MAIEGPSTAASPQLPGNSPILTAGGIFLAIAALYFGREIFIPFSLGILLSFALTPLVNWLRRRHLPRIAAVLMAVAVAFVIIGALAYVTGRQLVELADNLPAYRTTITQKIRALQNAQPGGGVVDQVTTTIEDLGKELAGDRDLPETSRSQSPRSATVKEPVTVRIEPPKAKPLEVIQTVIGPLISPLATAGLVVVFAIFVLLEREDVRDRFIKLAGAGDLQRSTQALDDAARRVSRYLLMQLVVNFSYGIPVGAALYFIGVPNAVLWGLLAVVLRFIPYLGPFLAALFPIALAIAVDPGWSMVILVIALFLVAELISNNAIEPWLYGASTGLSPLAIIIAAIFWTVLWGPVGLFLATPLTVCLVVIGRYVPQLEFLGVLLGSDPVLAPEERLYQRLLAGNLEEATELAETYVDENSTPEFYDSVAIPALRLAENDRHRSTTDTNYRRRVAETAICVVKELADHIREKTPQADDPVSESRDAEASTPQPLPPGSVLCLAGRTEIDRAASEMLAEVLDERNITTRVLPPIAVATGALSQLDLAGVKVVCLSYFDYQPQVYARYICRRLRRRAPHIKLAVCCWNLTVNAPENNDLAKQTSSDAVFVSLQACVARIEEWLSHPSQSVEPSADLPDNEQERLAILSRLGLDSRNEFKFDQLTRRIAEEFEAPIALVSLLGSAAPASGEAIPTPTSEATEQQRDEVSLEAHVVAMNEMLVVEDIENDPRFADSRMALEKGIRFYAGAPLRTAEGMAIGSLCIIDTKPRTFGKAEQDRLQSEADALMARLARRGPEQSHEAFAHRKPAPDRLP
jgi:predicted PurR-regulated permease PerM/GAF domain-containing protein